jgi:hypothetical protein
MTNWDGSQPGQPLGSGGVQPEVMYVIYGLFYYVSQEIPDLGEASHFQRN